MRGTAGLCLAMPHRAGLRWRAGPRYHVGLSYRAGPRYHIGLRCRAGSGLKDASVSLLSVQSLTKRFGGFTAVSQVSFELGRGEILGLIGPNGSGKSTTFNVIAGLYQPSAGEVLLEGRSIAGLPPHQICRQGLARTFQIPRPFRKLGILENTLLAAYYGSSQPVTRAQAERYAIDALAMIGLPSDPDARVDGLGAAGLKKLEMARALATRPRLLLADESLGGLDEAEMAAAAGMLRRIRDEKAVTIIWVEHIMGVLMQVIDRCIVLDHGEVIAQGTPSAVTRDPRVIEVYLGRDAAQAQQQADAAQLPRQANLAQAQQYTEAGGGGA